jgi:hypothetical protein
MALFLLQSIRIQTLAFPRNKERSGGRMAKVVHQDPSIQTTNATISTHTLVKESQKDSVYRTTRARMEHHAISLIAAAGVNWTRPFPEIPVVVWPNVEYDTNTAASMHLEENGIHESLVLKLSNDLWDVSSHVIWIADGGMFHTEAEFCEQLLARVDQAIDKRKLLDLPLQWPIFIVDWSDIGKYLECTAVEEMVGLDFVNYAQRAIVYGRRWNYATQWINLGIVNPDKEVYFRHSPLPVRTDVVETLAHILTEQSYNMTLADSIEKLHRTVDITHFWPVDLVGVSNTDDARLRLRVSQVVARVGEMYPSIHVYVGLAGSASVTGRRTAQVQYVETMLKSKIVVVSQRDSWEDHYRLFEALVSGAMVMTDRMLSLPSGLENGTSVVEYTSGDDLKSKLLYYLQHEEERIDIAREGRLVAMTRHRTWHRMEEIVFGRVVTDCASLGRDDCPWIVHANDTIKGNTLDKS